MKKIKNYVIEKKLKDRKENRQWMNISKNSKTPTPFNFFNN